MIVESTLNPKEGKLPSQPEPEFKGSVDTALPSVAQSRLTVLPRADTTKLATEELPVVSFGMPEGNKNADTTDTLPTAPVEDFPNTETTTETLPKVPLPFVEITNGFGDEIDTARDFYDKIVIPNLRAGGRLVILSYEGKIYMGNSQSGNQHNQLITFLADKSNQPYDSNKVDFSTAIEFSPEVYNSSMHTITLNMDDSIGSEVLSIQEAPGSSMIPATKGFNHLGKTKMAELFDKIRGITCSWKKEPQPQESASAK